MKTLVVGAHGRIGRLLVPKLVERGIPVRAMVRAEAQRDDLEALGAEVVVADLEGEIEDAVSGCDALVFTAGSGAKTGADKTLLVDLWGVVKTIRACRDRSCRRFVLVSARRVEDPDRGPEAMRHYLVAKHVADDYLCRSGLDFTILRPGRLTDGPGQGRIRTTRPEDPDAQTVPREDVAEAIASCLTEVATIGHVVELHTGDRPIADALRAS